MDAQRVRAPNERVTNYYAEAELESIAKTVVVPTNDDDVRRRLRQIGEPAELAGEDRAARRARLRRILAQRKAAQIDETEQFDVSSDDTDSIEDAWIEGPPGLQEARERIAAYAERQSAARLHAEHQRWLVYESDKSRFTSAELLRRRRENSQLAKTALVGTQSGFPRAVGSVASNGRFVVTGDWSGSLSVLDMQQDMAFTVSAAPHASTPSSAGSGQTCVAWSSCIASGSADGSVALHDYAESCLKTRARLRGHAARVSCVAFHPSDAFLLSTSHDTTWRMWDVERAACVLDQPGHAQALNTVSTHEDGALVLTAGDDALGRVWDVRSGKSVVDLRGHARSVHASAWRNNHAVLGGADNQCLVWDLRKATHPLVAIPAHNDVVTDICIRGNAMATSSMDGTLRLWDCDTWRLQRTLSTPTRLLSVAAIDDGGWATARWDRCVDWYTSSMDA